MFANITLSQVKLLHLLTKKTSKLPMCVVNNAWLVIAYTVVECRLRFFDSSFGLRLTALI